MRDQKIDIARGIVIGGMIFIHIFQFFVDSRLPINIFFNLVSFSGFVYLFGYSSYLAYFSKNFSVVWMKMLFNALKIYSAYVISGCAYNLFIKDSPWTFKMLANILIFKDIPQYSEFMVSFVGIILLMVFAFHIVSVILNISSWAFFTLLIIWQYLSSHIPAVFMFPQAFPVLSYISLYILGAYMARHKTGISKKILAVSGVVFIFGGWSLKYYPVLMVRFPPTPLWVFSSLLPIFVYYCFGNILENNNVGKILAYFGKRSMGFYLWSNLVIFTLRSQVDWYFGYFGAVVLTAVVILAISIGHEAVAKFQAKTLVD